MCEPIYNSNNKQIIKISNDATQEDIDKILKNTSFESFIIEDMAGNILYIK